MKGSQLTIFTYENQKHKGVVLHDWLLGFAKEKGMPGGSAFRGVAGYGHTGEMHEEHFYELGSNVPMQVVFIGSIQECKTLIHSLKKENLGLFYTLSPIEYEAL